MDVPHLRGGRVRSAPVFVHAEILSPLAESRILYFCHFRSGIPDGVAAADSHRSLPLGLQREEAFSHGVHPLGLRPSLGDIGAVF